MIAKHAVITSRGGPDVIDVADYEVPEPVGSQVRIQVEYAGLAYADVMLRRMSMPGLPKPPLTPGADIAGIVERLGPDAKKSKLGERVAALLMTDFGGHSQYVCCDENRVMPIPDDIPSEKAVCLLVNYLTAYKMLFGEVGAAPGATILVHGGSGGVGSALVQLAVSHGQTVITTASTAKLDLVRKLGALPIDYGEQDFVQEVGRLRPEGVDAVFNHMGGSYTKRSLGVLKRGGILVAYGMHGDIGLRSVLATMLGFMLRRLTAVGKRLVMFQLRDNDPSTFLEDLAALFDLYRQKKVDPVIARIFPLSEAASASAYLEGGEARGKVLLDAR